MDGKSWLIDYLLVVYYMANIKSLIRGKYKYDITQSIKGHIKAHLPNASKNNVSSFTSDLKRCIHHPRSETTVVYSNLDANAQGLVQFHSDGYGVDDEGYISDYFIDEVLKGQESISQIVLHFAICLQQQQLLQDNFLDGAKEDSTTHVSHGRTQTHLYLQEGYALVIEGG